MLILMNKHRRATVHRHTVRHDAPRHCAHAFHRMVDGDHGAGGPVGVTIAGAKSACG